MSALRFARMKTPTGWAGNWSNDFCLCREASKHRDQFVEPVFTAKRLVSRVIELVRGFSSRLTAAFTAVALAAAIVPVSAGAGEYYLRTGLGFEETDTTAFLDVNCDSQDSLPLYGCGRDSAGNPRRSLGSFRSLAVLELGIGYDTGTAARYEFLVDYRPQFRFSGEANYLSPGREQTTAANVKSVSAMAAAYFDLDRFGFSVAGPYRPFIGAGVGAARNTVKNKSITFPTTMTIVPGGSHVDMAWMATAGFSVGLDDQVMFDFAWRYSDLGEVRTGMNEGRVVRRDGTGEPTLLNLAPTWARLSGHGIRLSLRRSF